MAESSAERRGGSSANAQRRGWITAADLAKREVKLPMREYLTARSAKERASARIVSEAAEIDTSTQLSSNTRTVLRRGAVQNVTEAVNLRLRER